MLEKKSNWSYEGTFTMQCLMEGTVSPLAVKVLRMNDSWAFCLLKDEHGMSFIVKARWQREEKPLEQVLTEGHILMTAEEFEGTAKALQKHKVGTV